jgi:hypothetical protein
MEEKKEFVDCRDFQYNDTKRNGTEAYETWAKFSTLSSGVLVYPTQLHT